MKLDILAIAAHPDDIELCCSGTILLHKELGKKVGVVDLTQGELGSRGTIETRYDEAKKASELLGLDARENLKMRDGFFEQSEENKIKIVRAIRKYKPEIVLANAPTDRHPDHGRASKLISDACFLSGLIKIETFGDDGKKQEAWRPKNLLHYIQDNYIKPDILIDITPFWEKKQEVIAAYETQFFKEGMTGPKTPISSKSFWDYLEARARSFGREIQVDFAEGYVASRHIGVKDLFSLI